MAASQRQLWRYVHLKLHGNLKPFWKMLFISPRKLFSFSRYFNFLSWLFGHVAKQFDQKHKVNFKFWDITVWLRNNCNTHITQYREKQSKRTIKFGQLTEYNMINIFLEKSYIGCGGETGPRPFSEKFKLSISLDQYSDQIYSLFLLYVKLRAIAIFWN